MSAARVLTRPLGGSPLAELAAGVDGGGFFPPRPSSAAAWRARMDEVRNRIPTGWLSAMGRAFGDDAQVAARLRRVADARGVVVTTGQQPGLFGGPIYSWSKAISALTLAEELESATGIPTIPVFWAATDDADYAEASVTHVATRTGLRELRLPPPSREGASMAEQPLGDVQPVLQELITSAGSAAYDQPLSALRTAYAAGSTLGDAYVRLMRQMLEPLGIAVLDASHQAVRQASQPFLALALRRSPQLDAALADRETALRAAGHEPQVRHVPELSLIFEYVNGAKHRIPLRRAGEMIGRSDAALGPNVLLRPILERALVPTIAYTAGPGELAYFAQVSPLAPILDVPTPLAVPRWSGLIIEPYVDRILERYGLTIDELGEPHAVLKRLVLERVPGAVTQSLASMRDGIHHAIEALRRVLAQSEPLVDDRVVHGAEGQLMHRVDRLERRVLAAAKRREAEITQRVEAAHAALHPLGRTQERVLNMIPILAREGPDLIAAMRQAARQHAASLVHSSSGVNDAADHRAAPIAT